MLAVQRPLSYLSCNSLHIYSHCLHLTISPIIYQFILLSVFEPLKSFVSTFMSLLEVTLNLTSLCNDPMERNGNNQVPGRQDTIEFSQDTGNMGGRGVVSSACYFTIIFLFNITEVNYLLIPTTLSINIKQHGITPNTGNLNFYNRISQSHSKITVSFVSSFICQKFLWQKLSWQFKGE